MTYSLEFDRRALKEWNKLGGVDFALEFAGDHRVLLHNSRAREQAQKVGDDGA
jgi:mRNA-degrading endonuclease RelE of RelBE toxin-antitoxin system